MYRRTVRSDGGLEICREVQPGTNRRLISGAVLNVLQWVKPETARFTVEGEGAEIWCCPNDEMERQTIGVEATTA
jgi:hypothetical protein